MRWKKSQLKSRQKETQDHLIVGLSGTKFFNVANLSSQERKAFLSQSTKLTLSGLCPRNSIMTRLPNFGNSSDFPHYNTTPSVARGQQDTRTAPQIVRDEIITPYENDPSLVFEDLSDFLRLSKINMGTAEKLKFIAAVVKAYNLSATCKSAISAQCAAKFGGGI